MELFRFLKWSDSILVVFGILVTVAVALIEPATTILLGRIFDSLQKFGLHKISSSKFMDEVLQSTTGLFSLALITLVLGWVEYTIWVYTSYKQGHRARKQLYDAFLDRKSTWYDVNQGYVGVASMSFKDIQDIENAVGRTMCDVVTLIVGLVAQLVVAFYYSWAVTLVCLAGIPVVVVLTAVLSTLMSKRIAKSKTVFDALCESATWVLQSLQTVKILQCEMREKCRMHTMLLKAQDATISYYKVSFVMMGLVRGIILMIFVQGFYFGSYMVQHHGLSSGSVMTVFWSCLAAAGQAQSLMSDIVDLKKGTVSARRLVNRLQCDKAERYRETIGLVPPPAQGHVEFCDVVFSYPTRTDVVLGDLSIRFEAGRPNFVIGPSGCGKSSIANLLCRNYPIQAGQILLDGHSIDLIADSWLADNIYVVEQQSKLFDISIRDNICIGSRYPEKVSVEQLNEAIRVACADFVYDLPDGINTNGGAFLSGGQQQRIALARAFVCDAPIMVFDECTSALDPDLQKRVMANIIKFRRNKTSIIITHNYAIIPVNEPVFVFHDNTVYHYSSVTEIDAQIQTEESIPTEDIISEPHSKAEVQTKNKKENGFGAVDWNKFKVHVRLFHSINHKKLLFLGMTVVIGHAVVNPVFAFVFSKLLMGILPNSGVDVTMWAMLVLMCACLDGILTYLTILLNVCTEKWLCFIRGKLFNNLLDRRVLGKEQSAYYVKLIASDSERCGQIITRYWVGIVNVITLGLVGIIWSLATGAKLALVGISIIPLFIIVGEVYKRVNDRWSKSREAMRVQVIKLLNDVITSVRNIKMQRLEHYFKDRYLEKEAEVHKLSFKMAAWVGFGFGAIQIFPLIAEGLLLWYGMKLISIGEYTATQTMQVFSLLIFTLVTCDQVATSITMVGTGFEAADRLMDAVEDQTGTERLPVIQTWEKTDFENLKYGRIIMREIGIVYPGDRKVLGGFNLDINPGEVVAVVGPSGSGKSTLARLLMRFESPTIGTIYLDGCRIDSIPQKYIRRNIGMVNQMPLDFFDDTIMANLTYGLDECNPEAEAQAVNACKKCGIDEFITSLEDGYKTRMKSTLLSGGQLQRLGIARALARNPQVLILDECTSALDPVSTTIIKELIQSYKVERNMSILIITHQMDVASVADRTVCVQPADETDKTWKSLVDSEPVVTIRKINSSGSN